MLQLPARHFAQAQVLILPIKGGQRASQLYLWCYHGIPKETIFDENADWNNCYISYVQYSLDLFVILGLKGLLEANLIHQTCPYILLLLWTQNV